MFWDPYDNERRRRLREQQRREQERIQQERARERTAAQAGVPPAFLARVEEALAELRRERDEMEARLARATSQLEQRDQALATAQSALEKERAARQKLETEPPAAIPAELLDRFESELANAQRERDEWEARYQGALALLEEERQSLADEAAAQRDQLRAEADAQRERLNRNAEQRAYEDNRRVLLNLLAVADNFGRALDGAGSEGGPLIEGLRATQRSFIQALTQSGVEPLESLGEPFDPALHEAVGTRHDPQQATGTVVQVLQPGYRFRGALLRPARVIVAE